MLWKKAEQGKENGMWGVDCSRKKDNQVGLLEKRRFLQEVRS